MFYNRINNPLMQKISPIEKLKTAILLAEDRQNFNGKLFKKQLSVSWDTVKNGNLLISPVKEANSHSGMVRLVAKTALGLTTGYLTNRIIIGTSSIILRSVLSGILQFSATRFSSNNANTADR
jgi:hypothetical protein